MAFDFKNFASQQNAPNNSITSNTPNTQPTLNTSNLFGTQTTNLNSNTNPITNLNSNINPSTNLNMTNSLGSSTQPLNTSTFPSNTSTFPSNTPTFPINNTLQNNNLNNNNTFPNNNILNNNTLQNNNLEHINPTTKFRNLPDNIQLRIIKLYNKSTKPKINFLNTLNLNTINTVISELKNLKYNNKVLMEKFEKLLEFKENIKYMHNSKDFLDFEDENMVNNNIRIKEYVDRIKFDLIDDIKFYNKNIENRNVVENCIKVIECFINEIELLESKNN